MIFSPHISKHIVSRPNSTFLIHKSIFLNHDETDWSYYTLDTVQTQYILTIWIATYTPLRTHKHRDNFKNDQNFIFF